MEQQDSKLKMNLINNMSIKIYTIITYFISILLYEIFFCNGQFVTEKITNKDVIYNFSLSRIFFYIVILVLYLVCNKKMIQEALKTAKNKTKRILIYSYIPIMIFAIIAFYVRSFNNISIQSLARVTLGAITLIDGSIFLIYVSKNHIKNVILATFTFGLVFCIGTEFYHALDEKKHFISTFNLANLNFDYVNHPLQSDDTEAIPHRVSYNNFYKLFAQKYKGDIRPNTDEGDTSSTPTTYSKVLYICPAIGVFIAKTIGGSVADVFIAGRVFNVITYAILVCIALKILPFKKNVFTAIALLPMVMLLAASYSIDGVCIGLVFIFTSYILKLYSLEEIKLKQWGILILLFLLMLFAKSMAYLAVGALVFILPLWKIVKKQNIKIKIGLAVISILIAISVVGVLFYIKDNMISTDTRGGGEVDAKSQINYLTNNPKKIVSLEFNYTIESLLNFGWIQSLHQIVFFTPEYGSATMLIILLFLFYVAITDDSYKFKVKEKFVFIATFFTIFFMTNIILYICYTPVGDTTIAGYQPRYLFPIIPFLLMAVPNKNIEVKKDKNNLGIPIMSGVILMIGLIELILVNR